MTRLRLLWTYVLLTLGSALVLTTAAFAYAKKPSIADEARAEAAVLRLAETPNGFKRAKDKAESFLTCQNFNPKTSDLVQTARAVRVYRGGPNEVDNVVRILASPAMVRIDEQRSFIPALGTCLAGSMRAHAPKAMTVLTSQAYAFPNVARVTLAYRVPWEVRSGGRVYSGITDLIAFDRGRGEGELDVSAVLGVRGTAQVARTRQQVEMLERTMAASVAKRLPTG